MKFTLSLNSHSLSSFARCPAEYLYGSLIQIEGIGSKPRLERGTLVAKWLEVYYKNRMRPKMRNLAYLSNQELWTQRFIKETHCSSQEAYQNFSSLIAYRQKYKNEEWIPLAAERGFSKILYEDSDNLFVYEGRPDLLAILPDEERIVVDHKTASKQYTIYPYSNQPLGYCWALNTRLFAYNYIKYLSKTYDFYREPTRFTDGDIEDWKENTIEWYFKIKDAMQNRRFTKSLNCTQLYGMCQYTTICKCTKDFTRDHVIRSQFRRRHYRSW